MWLSFFWGHHDFFRNPSQGQDFYFGVCISRTTLSMLICPANRTHGFIYQGVRGEAPEYRDPLSMEPIIEWGDLLDMTRLCGVGNMVRGRIT